jgi:glutamate/tyrosine decarboxylase-like PLP-dependent enzyme
VELVVLEWIRGWIGFPEGAGGLFTSGGSAANLDAVVALREAADNPPRPSFYMGDQAHSALIRAARIAGVPAEGIRVLPSDDAFRLRLDALARAVEEDRAAGRTPVAVLANGGATNTGTVDPLEALADFCRAEGVRLHVDAAYGGFSVLTTEGREAFRGLERADSVALDAHKWLFQPFEAGCLLVRDVRMLERAFHTRPEYLQDVELGTAQVNFADRGLQLTRSFRALKVWMTVQVFGMEAIREGVRNGILLARRAGEHIRASPLMELRSPPSLGVVCFRVRPPEGGATEEELEELNRRVQDRVVASGVAMTSSTRLKGSFALRLCILSHATAWEDVRATLEAMEATAEEFLGG